MRYEADPNVHMMVMLGEVFPHMPMHTVYCIMQVGGVLEYEVIAARKAGKLTKPMVAWCIGTCAEHITSEVQFGHAGASANATVS